MKKKSSRRKSAANRVGSNVVVRHPASVALDEWLASPEGDVATQPATLDAPVMQRHYLTNRLKRAFNAGWAAAEKRGGPNPYRMEKARAHGASTREMLAAGYGSAERYP